MRYILNDNIKIPHKYWVMSIEELEEEQKILYEKYQAKKPSVSKPKNPSSVKVFL